MSSQALEVRMVHSIEKARLLIGEGWEFVSGLITEEEIQILMKRKVIVYSLPSSSSE